MKSLRLALIFLPLTLLACGGEAKQELWIYTSVYKEVYPLFEPGLARAFPEIEFRWYQSGSEKIAAKLLAERQGGGSRCDLLMTSDLFFYQELKKLDLLLPLSGPVFEAIPERYRDPDAAFAIQRFPLMVIAYNRDRLATEAPRGFEDLLDERFEGLLTMPSPLESGSTLTTTLYLYHRFGTPYFERLRELDVLAAGGNGSTLARIQSGERPVGMVLMENVLKARQMGLGSVEIVLPAEGALPIPSPLAVLSTTENPELARRVVDWFFSEEARQVIVQGWMHTAFPGDPAPAGAPPWAELPRHPWDLATFAVWGEKRQEVKTLFQQTVLQ